MLSAAPDETGRHAAYATFLCLSPQRVSSDHYTQHHIFLLCLELRDTPIYAAHFECQSHIGMYVVLVVYNSIFPFRHKVCERTTETLQRLSSNSPQCKVYSWYLYRVGDEQLNSCKGKLSPGKVEWPLWYSTQNTTRSTQNTILKSGSSMAL